MFDGSTVADIGTIWASGLVVQRKGCAWKAENPMGNWPKSTSGSTAVPFLIIEFLLRKKDDSLDSSWFILIHSQIHPHALFIHFCEFSLEAASLWVTFDSAPAGLWCSRFKSSWHKFHEKSSKSKGERIWFWNSHGNFDFPTLHDLHFEILEEHILNTELVDFREHASK